MGIGVLPLLKLATTVQALIRTVLLNPHTKKWRNYLVDEGKIHTSIDFYERMIS